MPPERRYLPAASLDILLPAYDPVMRLFGFTRALQPLVDQAQLRPGHAVLDIGCGTGAVSILTKQSHPDVSVTGVDPDPRALARAARKAHRANLEVRFDRGFADAMDYPDAAFDRVFSSMMLHHVPRADKPGLLAEVLRVLKPGGRLELLDFAGGAHSFLAHTLHGRHASDSMNARLLQWMHEAGFTAARRTATHTTPFGALGYYQATRPS